jgi:uncharacterized membrane protein
MTTAQRNHGRPHIRLAGSLALVCALISAADVHAQRSGGRFGGSSGFRSSSSSSSSYRSSSSSSYRSSSSSYNSGYRSSSSYGSTRSTTSTTTYVPPPPPWLTAVQYVRPQPSLTGYLPTSPTTPAVVSPAESQVLAQRNEQGDWQYGPFRFGAAVVGALVSFLPLAGVSYAVSTLPKSSGAHSPVPGASASPQGPLVPVMARTQGMGECEVRRVTIAFDWRARAQLQQSLDQIASSVDMGSPYGLCQGSDMARRLLQQWLSNARAACFVSLKGSASAAEMLFGRVCEDLNRRYDQATISNNRRNEPPEVTARREEGEGFVVVSMIVGINGALAPLPEWPTIDSVAQALATLVPATPDMLAALEVVWSPSIDQDRLSSAEMSVLYPELVSLQGTEPIGRVICRPCKTVYARELGSCPTCGSSDAAPSPASAQQQQYAYNPASSNMIPCPYCRKPTPAYEVQCQHCGGRVKN